jgi:hypothetical protein
MYLYLLNLEVFIYFIHILKLSYIIKELQFLNKVYLN